MPADLPAVTDKNCAPGSGQNYAGQDLTGVTEWPRDLTCADLSRAKLDGADLGSVVLDRALLRGASLKG
ncbi:pentapeptide repeat-containing protein [Thermocatellispora tengchongensis]|uniref:pentapeptide repeat-containing protein n=1 Tax=Thermocatellispora tengchongensis TaxID=1073253 RepID=UPI00363FCCD6